MSRWLLAAVSVLLAGCATLQGSNSLGPEPSEWVFIRSTNSQNNGVYRCQETPKGPLCTQATMVTR